MMPIPQQGGQPPQMPPPSMGAFQQAASGGPPPMPPQSGGAPPQGQSPQGGQPMNPMIILQMIKTLPPQIQQALAQQVLQGAAQQGRGGDSMIAHLTPGEKTVPPEIQTPKVLATLNKAYKDKGVQPQQFTAGTPQSSKNPSTGLPEYNFMSAFLPIATGMAGAALAPMTGGASLGLSEAAMAAIGSGLGTTAGGLAVGQSPTQAALSGLGAGAGGYAMGNVGNGLTMMGNAPEAAGSMTAAQQAAILGSKDPTAALAAAGKMGIGSGAAAPTSADILSKAAAAPASLSNLYHMGPAGSNLMGAVGSGVGSMIGGAIGAPPKSNPPAYPPGFNTPMDPVGSKGSAQQQLGMTNSQQPRPTFTGFNPMTNNPAAYNFFPGAQ